MVWFAYYKWTQHKYNNNSLVIILHLLLECLRLLICFFILKKWSHSSFHDVTWICTISETNKKYVYVLLDKGYILLVGQIRVESNTGADGLRISWI